MPYALQIWGKVCLQQSVFNSSNQFFAWNWYFFISTSIIWTWRWKRKFNTKYNTKKLFSLPGSHANVPPVILPKTDPTLPDICKNIPNDSPLILEATEREKIKFTTYTVLPVYMKRIRICLSRWILNWICYL